MKVLIVCEESQTVCKAFREKGHEAYSCDIQEPSGGHPEWHILGDVIPLLNGRCSFETMDETMHCISGPWDMIIAHPPCTYLTAAGAVRLFNKYHKIKNIERYIKGLAAKSFFLKILNADCERIAIENPVPLKIFGLPKYDQIIEPYFFGHPWRKRTCLWLKNLPKLCATSIVEAKGLWVGSTSANRDPEIYTKYELKSNRDSKTRSKTFSGIAEAMAEQWGVTLHKNNTDVFKQDRLMGDTAGIF